MVAEPLTDTAATSVVDQYTGPRAALYCGDCCEVVAGLPDNSVDYIIYSPPFSSLYTYSNSERDMGNVRSNDEFFAHYGFLSRELLRVLKPGRLLSIHCMLIPLMKSRDGVIGLYDFRGDLIRHHQADGMIFHGEVTIWKDPVVEMQRTKSRGLLYKELKKDSAVSRQGLPDYLVTLRKPGDNPTPITKAEDDYPVELWQRIASPVWFDIRPGDTLQYQSARADEDERHIAPLQLGVIRRAVHLWTNPGEVVLTPFAGIGSELFVAVQEGRRALGAELKRSYYDQAVRNIRRAELEAASPRLFDPATL